MITQLQENEIFVFGSNRAGRHGKGAAKTAKHKFGAKYGQGEGLQGRSYAIPTKDRNLRTLRLARIALSIRRFLEFADNHPELRFLVTPIGCGLAGYKPEEIAALFFDVPENVVLPNEFTEALTK